MEAIKNGINMVVGYGSLAVQLLPGGKFQVATQNIRGTQIKTFKNLPNTLAEIYEPFFTENADNTWVVYEGQRITYRKAREMYRAIGKELVHGLGMKHGDRVGIASE